MIFGRKKREREVEEAAERERWANLSNLEKAKQAMERGRDFPFAPGATSLYTQALCYLLLEYFDREDRSYRRPHERSSS